MLLCYRKKLCGKSFLEQRIDEQLEGFDKVCKLIPFFMSVSYELPTLRAQKELRLLFYRLLSVQRLNLAALSMYSFKLSRFLVLNVHIRHFVMQLMWSSQTFWWVNLAWDMRGCLVTAHILLSTSHNRATINHYGKSWNPSSWGFLWNRNTVANEAASLSQEGVLWYVFLV